MTENSAWFEATGNICPFASAQPKGQGLNATNMISPTYAACWAFAAGGIKWSLQHHGGGVAMKARQRRSDRALRGVLRSPGRPGVARREDRRRFWAAIALGLASEAAAARVGVSPAVGARWFREAGGMPPSTLAPSSKPLSGRYLSLAEREEIALWRV